MQQRRYHHGNLRQALVDAALLLIETKGPTGFTLSEAAKNAGVTPAAVYRHFEGREDLIAEAALQGFAIFAERMETAYNGGQPNALRAFEATGQAYLNFARTTAAITSPCLKVACRFSAAPSSITPRWRRKRFCKPRQWS